MGLGDGSKGAFGWICSSAAPLSPGASEKPGNSEDSHAALQGAAGVGSTGLVNFIDQQVAEDGPPS